MTPTPDPALATRLSDFAKSDCRDNDFAKWCQTAWTAYSMGQLITLADHEAAMQEITYERDFLRAENEAMREMAPPPGDRPLFKRLMEVRAERDAAIRARKGDAL